MTRSCFIIRFMLAFFFEGLLIWGGTKWIPDIRQEALAVVEKVRDDNKSDRL